MDWKSKTGFRMRDRYLRFAEESWPTTRLIAAKAATDGDIFDIADVGRTGTDKDVADRVRNIGDVRLHDIAMLAAFGLAVALARIGDEHAKGGGA